MRVWDRLLLRGLSKYIPEGSSVLAIEVGASDSLGPMHKVTAVLTTDALLLASPVRARTILTTIPRADIREVKAVEPTIVDISFDDYSYAVRRVVHLDLSRHGDHSEIIELLGNASPNG